MFVFTWLIFTVWRSWAGGIRFSSRGVSKNRYLIHGGYTMWQFKHSQIQLRQFEVYFWDSYITITICSPCACLLCSYIIHMNYSCVEKGETKNWSNKPRRSHFGIAGPDLISNEPLLVTELGTRDSAPQDNRMKGEEIAAFCGNGGNSGGKSVLDSWNGGHRLRCARMVSLSTICAHYKEVLTFYFTKIR